MPTTASWQHYRTLFAILMGSVAFIAGIWKNEPAFCTIGAGLIGFSPAAKGP